MRKFWQKNKPVLACFILWEVLQSVLLYVAPTFWSLNKRFLGDIPLANFDGVYYLTIARSGYGVFQQAFFPFYPNLIRWLSQWTALGDISVALYISHVSFLFGLILFYDLASEINKRTSLWAVVLLLLFPTSFFFGAVYSESLFFFISVLCIWAIKHKIWWLAGISGLLASNTRLFGIFLFPLALWEYRKLPPSRRLLSDLVALFFIPIGLIMYMMYLIYTVGDPLAFFHVQPAFGAYRTGNSIIFLPQVIWRYLKIFVTVPATSFIYLISVFEFSVFSLGIWAWWLGIRRRIDESFLIYALAILIVPTLTGTLSSVPRYILSAFPLFFVLANVHNMLIKLLLAFLFGAGLIFFATAFFSGYFVG